jgi:hypothetical protein
MNLMTLSQSEQPAPGGFRVDVRAASGSAACRPSGLRGQTTSVT